MKWILFPLLPLALCGCNPQPDAIIHWHKVGACNGGISQTGDPTESYNAGPNQAYVIFAIESIDNTAVNQKWLIDATKFHVGSANFDLHLMLYSAKLGPFALETFPIPAKTSISFQTNGYGALVVPTSTSDGAKEASTTNYSLLYTPNSGDPGVIMEQGTTASTAYTPNCADVQLK